MDGKGRNANQKREKKRRGKRRRRGRTTNLAVGAWGKFRLTFLFGAVTAMIHVSPTLQNTVSWGKEDELFYVVIVYLI